MPPGSFQREYDLSQGELGHGDSVGGGSVGQRQLAVPKLVGDQRFHRSCGVENGPQPGGGLKKCPVKKGAAPARKEQFDIAEKLGLFHNLLS